MALTDSGQAGSSPAANGAGTPQCTAVLHVSGLSGPEDVLRFGRSLERQPGIASLALLCSDPGSTWYVVTLADSASLAGALIQVDGFFIHAAPLMPGLDVTVQRIASAEAAPMSIPNFTSRANGAVEAGAEAPAAPAMEAAAPTNEAPPVPSDAPTATASFAVVGGAPPAPQAEARSDSIHLQMAIDIHADQLHGAFTAPAPAPSVDTGRPYPSEADIVDATVRYAPEPPALLAASVVADPIVPQFKQPSAAPVERTEASGEPEALAEMQPPRDIEGTPDGRIIAADARPGGAAPISEYLSLVAYPFGSFTMLNAFLDALHALHGVRETKVRRFYKGTLQLSIEYEGAIPLIERLREVKGFAWQSLSDTPQGIEMVLADKA